MIYPALGKSKKGRVIDFRWYRRDEHSFAFAAGPPSRSTFLRFLKYPYQEFKRNLTFQRWQREKDENH